MSEPDDARQGPDPRLPEPVTGPASNEDPPQAVPGPMPSVRQEEPTVGTGSTIAIGCVVGMLVVLGVGILIMLWLR